VPNLPELIVLRHGETVWNREGRMQGACDSPLTARGVAQARAQGGLLAALGVRAGTFRAFSSPQGRARATADLALAPLGLAAVADARLREIGTGLWAGLTRADIEARWPGPPDEGLLAFYDRAPQGEGLAAAAARLADFLSGLDGPTVVVTHGLTSRLLRALALGLPPAAAEHLPGGQGVVHRIRAGRHEVLGGDGLPGAGAVFTPGI
jgi:probable phosphoglycerate mutase